MVKKVYCRMKILLLLTGAAALLLPKVWQKITLDGYFNTVYNQAPGPCKLIPEISDGSEDLAILPSGKAIISSGLRFMSSMQNAKYKDVRGKMFLLDLNNDSLTPIRMSIYGDIDLDAFNPHGISVHRHNDRMYVYVINHAADDQQVNKFLIDETQNSLKLVKTFRDDSFKVLNDLTVVEDDTFYATNYLHTENLWEKSLLLHWGSVVLYEKGQVRIVASNFYLPNGINQSPDGSYIYLASIGDRAIRVFRRVKENELEDVQTFYTSATADNIDVDKETGTLTTVGSPKRYKIPVYLADPHRNMSPTQVLRYLVQDGTIKNCTQLYMNDGMEFSGGSVAAVYKHKMLVGSIASNTMICEIKYMIS